jgi:sulfur-oxidizing protein SoxA
MQSDDFINPAMIYVDQAMEDFNTVMGSEGNSCASCHTPEDFEMVRATYPQWDEETGGVQTVEMQVIECQTDRMGMEEAFGYNSQEMRNMTALIASVGRGQVVNVAIDGPAQSTWEQGREIYYTRFGQLELSCANCHEDNYGNLIRADHLSQGQINGFPTYRLKDANLVGIHNRFRGCIRDTRAETFSIGSPEFVALELYVASRGNGLTIEGPAVRN